MTNSRSEQEVRDAVNELIVGDAAAFQLAEPEAFQRAILSANLVHEESRAALHRWVRAGRHAGLAWAQIGQLLGITRQAAQQRFGTGDAPAPATNLIVRNGVTAFNEIAALIEEGQKGRELVHAGPLTLLFRQRPHQWEYKRIIILTLSPTARLRQAGWIHAATWYPFLYLKRPLDTAEVTEGSGT